MISSESPSFKTTKLKPLDIARNHVKQAKQEVHEQEAKNHILAQKQLLMEQLKLQNEQFENQLRTLE